MQYRTKQAFSVLNLEHSASEKEIRQAYARLAKATRPDTDPDGFTRIRDAYEQALTHVQSAKLADKPEPAFAHTPNQKTNVSVSTSESGLKTVLNTAPDFDEQQEFSQNRFENPSDPTYADADADADDYEDKHSDEFAAERTFSESVLHENEHTSEKFYQESKQLSATEQTNEKTTEIIATKTTVQNTERTAEQTTSQASERSTAILTEQSTQRQNKSSNEQFFEHIGNPDTKLSDHNQSQNENETIAQPQSFVKIQQLLDESNSLLNQQGNYNAQIEQELISITDEIDNLTADLGISTRDDALEQLAIQIFDNDSAPFGFVEKVATHLELVDTVLPYTAPLSMTSLQSRYHYMREVNEFEQRGNGEDKFIAYFIHGKSKPFRLSGFPTRKDTKLYAIYAEMLLSSKPPRPDLIHPNAQIIIDHADALDASDAKAPPVLLFGKGEIRYFLRIVWFIGWVVFGLYLASLKMAPSPSDKVMDAIMNPSEELQRRIDKARKLREMETGD